MGRLEVTNVLRLGWLAGWLAEVWMFGCLEKFGAPYVVFYEVWRLQEVQALTNL